MQRTPPMRTERVPPSPASLVVPHSFEDAPCEPKARRCTRRAQRALHAATRPSRKEAQWN